MRKEGSQLISLLPLAVFALFALCMMGVLLTGAGVYQRISQTARSRDESRTAALYLTTRVRQGNDIRIEEFDGCEALVFPQKIDEEQYVTRVYCHEGHLRELFCTADARLSAEDGEVLLPLEKMALELDGAVLTVDTGEFQMTFTLPTGRRAGV